jgi:serine/threonine protein kinase/Tfp pilus assembly protein PilF
MIEPRSTSETRPSTDRPDDAEVEAAWVDEQVEHLAVAWARGQRLTAEELLAGNPGVADEAALRLVFEEVSLRRDAGEGGDTDEVVSRHPRLRSKLEALLACDRLMRPDEPVGFPDLGETLGDFQLLEELGRGRSGRTFLAVQVSLADRPVVLKVMALDEDEYLSLARLQHTHIVPLYSILADEGRGVMALCMPYLGGANFARILAAMGHIPPERRTSADLLRAIGGFPASPTQLEAGPGPYRDALGRATYVQAICWMTSCLADALQYAHQRGLVHMDVKPSNVLIAADGQPMLLDFHLARGPVRGGEDRLARLGGSPGWMSPEQRAAMRQVTQGRPVSAEVDGRSDIYSLGLLLHEALGGPADPDSPAPRSRLDRVNRAVSVGLADLVDRCIRADPTHRYPTAAELADDLRRHYDNLPLRGVANRSLAERLAKWRKRHPHAMMRGLARMAIAGAVAIVGWAACLLYIQRLHDVDSSLEDARNSQLRGAYEDASRAAGRGLKLAQSTPWAGSLVKVLETQHRLALRGRKAVELHRLADLIRFRYGVEPASGAEALRLLELGRALWSDPRLVRTPRGLSLSPAVERELGVDLRELAVVWADLRVRLATEAEVGQARLDALKVLADAEAAFGSSPSLRRERATHEQALGSPEADPGPDPPAKTPWEHYDLGRSLLRAGQFADAAAHFRATIDDRPQDLWPNFYQGLCAYRLGQHADALAAFRACVTISPRSAECLFNRGLANAALGRLDAARADYTRAIALDPSLARAALNRGILAYRSGQPGLALDDYRRALDAKPEQPLAGQIYFNQALAHLALDDRPSASAAANQSLQLGHPEAKGLVDSLGPSLP